MKKYIIKTSFLILFPAYLIASCGNKTNDDAEQPIGAKTVNVTFFNESSYIVKVHRDSFDGPVLKELPKDSPPQIIPVRVSDNNVGTIFSFEYVWIIEVIDGLNAEINEVPVSGIDPDLQILCMIEEDKPLTIQIPNPNPKNLEIRSAYMTILNTHNLPCVLEYSGSLQSQIDNNNVPIAPGKTGIYKNRYSLPVEGELCQGYRVDSVPVPEFIMKNGVIYNFKYDGSNVEKTWEEDITKYGRIR